MRMHRSQLLLRDERKNLLLLKCANISSKHECRDTMTETYKILVPCKFRVEIEYTYKNNKNARSDLLK